MNIYRYLQKTNTSMDTGGSTRYIGRSSAILRYNPEEDTWTEVGNMAIPRAGHAVSVVDANEMDQYCI